MTDWENFECRSGRVAPDPLRVRVVSVTPSPYQRDLFAALARVERVTLRVSYLEERAPDSPWPLAAMREFEEILPGRVWGKGRVRCHSNQNLPRPEEADVLVVNAPLTALTTRRLARLWRGHGAWVFWGEILNRHAKGWRRGVQDWLAAPLRGATAIWGVGREAVVNYGERFPTVPVFPLPYSCELAGFLQCARSPSERDPVFLFCGQMIPRKGIDVLLDAFAIHVKEGGRGVLRLVGREAGIRDLLDHCAEEVKQRVEVVGFVNPDLLPTVFAEADVFVLPSRHDGWGVVVPQAMAAALPVISTTTTRAAAELVTSGRQGLLVSPGDAKALAEAMMLLAREEGMRSTMGREAREATRELTPEKTALTFAHLAREAWGRFHQLS